MVDGWVDPGGNRKDPVADRKRAHRLSVRPITVLGPGKVRVAEVTAVRRVAGPFIVGGDVALAGAGSNIEGSIAFLSERQGVTRRRLGLSGRKSG
jgi:hypothetical protein